MAMVAPADGLAETGRVTASLSPPLVGRVQGLAGQEAPFAPAPVCANAQARSLDGLHYSSMVWRAAAMLMFKHLVRLYLKPPFRQLEAVEQGTPFTHQRRDGQRLLCLFVLRAV